jgi:hypothetical protein
VDNARRQYQECRYAELTKTLPGLLTQLHAACTSFDGDRQLRAYALSADAHHVAAGVLLKLDDQGLAYLAADRSIRAAHASQDPVTTGASARIITHTLMKDGHLSAAIDTARPSSSTATYPPTPPNPCRSTAPCSYAEPSPPPSTATAPPPTNS